MTQSKPLITHLISGLLGGGAETMLYKLLSRINPEIFRSEVISLTEEGLIGNRLKEIGIPVYALGMRRGRLSLEGLKTLTQLLRKNSPAVIQTWMYHSDLIGGLIGKWILGTPVVWNIRSDIVPFSQDKPTYLMTKTCALFSSFLPARIITCSEVIRSRHVSFGYDVNKILTIPNGFDLQTFKEDKAAYLSVRQELGVDPTTILIGLIARFDKRKNIPNFVEAARIITESSRNEIKFLLCGLGMDQENHELLTLLRRAGILDSCLLLGRREDIPGIMAALDIATSSSDSEGFPNVLGEAMACGVPCVATQAGDSDLIIGDTGILVTPKSPQALADGWGKVLLLDSLERKNLGVAAQQRIKEMFSLDLVVAQYENLYQEVLFSQYK